MSREILDGVGWRKGPRGRSWVEGGLLWGLFFSFSFLELERFANVYWLSGQNQERERLECQKRREMVGGGRWDRGVELFRLKA